MGSFLPKHIMFNQKKKVELCLIAMKIDAKCEGKLTFTFKNNTRNLENWVENSDFILESKMVELNQNENSKVVWWTRSSVKTLFYFENKWMAQLTKLFTHVQQGGCVRKFQESCQVR